MPKNLVILVDDDIEQFDLASVDSSNELPGYMAYYLLDLDEAGYDVRIARGPSDALAILQTIPNIRYLVALIDVLMPTNGLFQDEDPEQQGVQTGLHLARKIREESLIPRGAGIVILSNNVPPQSDGTLVADTQQLLKDNIVDKVLFKPDTSPSALVEQMNEMFRLAASHSSELA
jgi:CheY-like chemotaxis protein